MLSQEGQEYIKKNYRTETYKTIGKTLGIDRHTVGIWVKKLGLIKNFNRKKYYINDDYFDSIGPDQAYLLGFIMADGYVNNVGVEFTLSLKDYQVLDDINKSMDSNYQIKVENGGGKNKNKQYCRLRFKSLKIYNYLSSIGFEKNKTGNEFLPNLNNKQFPHFFRGLFDGDGHITFGNYERHYIRNSFGIGCSNKIFLEDIYDKIGIGSIYQMRENFYALYIQDRPGIKKIYDFMYKDSGIKLNRKYEKFNTLLNLIS